MNFNIVIKIGKKKMPKIQLNAPFIANHPKPKGNQKVDYFDTVVPGLLLEVRATGKLHLLSEIQRQVRKAAPSSG